MKPSTSLLWCTAVATCLIGAGVPGYAVDATAPNGSLPSSRQPVTLSLAEQNYLLDEMHKNLGAVAAVIGALGRNDPRQAAQAAQSRGMASYGDLDPSRPKTLSSKLPPAWKPMAGLVRRSFDELSKGIEAHESTTKSLGRVAQLMAVCNACHASYRLVVPR